MVEITCQKCHKTISAAESAAFCPYCGERLSPEGMDLSAVRNEPDPVKKHGMLLKLKAQHPDSLEVAEEILYLGRLYERSKRNLDFSVIKCYVLNIYLEPETMSANKREALRAEIFSHPDLDRCLELSENKDAFLSRYLEHISEEFVRLFLKGSSRYMRSFFGFTQTSKAPKYLALPATKMLKNMQLDESLTDAQRTLLTRAFYTAFARQADGETRYLDQELMQRGISITSE
jgi:hypothetical protein